MTNNELADKLYDAYSCLITECNMNCESCDYGFSKPSDILTVILDARAALMNMRWISVTEEFPPEDTWVLATVKYPDGDLSIRRVTYIEGLCRDIWEDEEMTQYDVTAWCKLPEPYQKGDTK